MRGRLSSEIDLPLPPEAGQRACFKMWRQKPAGATTSGGGGASPGRRRLRTRPAVP